MRETKNPAAINDPRRRFLRQAAMTLAAAKLGLISSADAQPGTATRADAPAIQSGTSLSGTSSSFGSLKQIDAGVLNVGYAEAGPPQGRNTGVSLPCSSGGWRRRNGASRMRRSTAAQNPSTIPIMSRS